MNVIDTKLPDVIITSAKIVDSSSDAWLKAFITSNRKRSLKTTKWNNT